MLLEEYFPNKQLSAFIKSYKIIESSDGMTNTVLPGTSLTMAFRFKGHTSYLQNGQHIKLPFAAVAGLQKSARRIHYSKETAAIIVQFRETGVSAFFRQPAHELFNQSISLDNFFPASEVINVQERLAQARNNVERILLLETFLMSKLNEGYEDILIVTAIQKIESASGNIRIKHLIDDLYLSKDAFEKRFRKLTGATPKQFAHIVKMNTVIRQTKNKRSYLDMVFDNGFYDQPHFNKDFKLFTGQTPTDFFKTSRYW